MRLLLIISFLCFTGLLTYAQESISGSEPQAIIYDNTESLAPVTFNENQIEKYAGSPHFDYTERTDEDNWWQRFKNWLSNLWVKFWFWLLGGNSSNPFLLFLIKVLPYLIIGIIVGFMIWLFYRLNPGAKLLTSKETAQVFYTEEEEIIKTKNIQELIDRALLNKDYRLAVRYYFLFVLKRLSETELISYGPDKTNTDYSKEIKQEYAPLFKKVSRLYEYIWYGNFNVSESDFLKAKALFVSLNSKIPKSVE